MRARIPRPRPTPRASPPPPAPAARRTRAPRLRTATHGGHVIDTSARPRERNATRAHERRNDSHAHPRVPFHWASNTLPTDRAGARMHSRPAAVETLRVHFSAADASITARPSARARISGAAATTEIKSEQRHALLDTTQTASESAQMHLHLRVATACRATAPRRTGVDLRRRPVVAAETEVVVGCPRQKRGGHGCTAQRTQHIPSSQESE